MDNRPASACRVALTLLLAVCLSAHAANSLAQARMQVGMNLFSIRYNSDNQLAFVDLMKGAAEWMTQDPAGFPISTDTKQLAAIPLDADGYPLQTPVTISGQQRTVYTAMVSGVAGNYPAGTYVVLYDGTGTLAFAGSSATVAGIAQLGPSQWRIELNVVPDTIGLYLKIVSSSAQDHVRNIRVLMPGTESSYLSQPFNQTFLGRVAPFTTLRFMEWNNNNTNTEVQWQSRRPPTYYTQSASGGLQDRGIAYEYLIQLCNTLQTGCWVNVPTQADANYLTQMATLFRDKLDPTLKIYLEYSNELWNQALSPTNYNWVENNSPAALSHSQKTAYQFKKVFAAWANVFGSAMSQRVMRVAAGNLSQGNQVVSDIMGYLNQGGDGGADAISVGAYFQFVQADYNSLNSLCPNVTTADVINLISSRMPTYYPILADIAQKAAGFGKPLLFYEGGQSQIPSVNCSNGQNAVRNAQIDPAMYTFYQTWLQKLNDTAGASLFLHFHLAGGGVFGALSNIFQSTSQKYQALLDYIALTPQYLATVSGAAAASRNLSVRIVPSTADLGRNGNLYVATIVKSAGSIAGTLLFHNGSTWLPAASPLPIYRSGPLADTTIALTGDKEVDLSAFDGTEIYVGYGLDETDLLKNSKWKRVYTVQ